MLAGFFVIMSGGIGFLLGAILAERGYKARMIELRRYRNSLWRSDLNCEKFNEPGTVFRFSFDGQRNVYFARIMQDKSVVPVQPSEVAARSLSFQ